MRPAMGMKKAKRRLSAGLATITPWRVARGLALCALLAAGTALYFNMASGGDVSSPSSIN
jgi:hypothetical protein